MQKQPITTRKKDILTILCHAQDYLRAADIAQEIGVSSRTILRELKEMETWLAQRQIPLIRKTGVGVFLQGTIEEKGKLLECMEEGHTVPTFSPLERQNILISELLQNNQPVKLYALSTILNVTEGTISNDLDKVEEDLKAYDLTLIRKPGLGVFIEGEERNKRRAMVNLIYENVEEKQLYKFIRKTITGPSDNSGNIEIRTKNRLLNLIDQDIILKLEDLIYQAEEEMDTPLPESAYVGLIVHLVLAIKRIQNHEKILMNASFLEKLRHNPEFLVAEQLAQKLSEIFQIEIPEDEVGYITMHLMGSKHRHMADHPEDRIITNYELVKIAREMIKIAEKETGLALLQNQQLLAGLVNHLAPTLKRLEMKMDIRNPLLEEIKTRYPHLMAVSKKAAKVLEKSFEEEIPESEIGYIAMHLGAAIEKKETFSRYHFRVAVACPSGIGTSRLLAARIEKEYKRVQVVDVISTLYIQEEWLQREGIDFIISTISIDPVGIPVVVVNPFLLEEDKEKIDQCIQSFSQEILVGREKTRAEDLDFRDQLLQIQEYSQAILQVLDHFFMKSLHPRDMKDLIDKVSQEIHTHPGAQAQLKRDLAQREAQGDTLMAEKDFHLLHCRSSSIEKLYFGAIPLPRGLKRKDARGEKIEIHLAILMLVPQNSTPIQLEVMGEVSKMLIDRPQLLSYLAKGQKQEAYREISHGFKMFYQEKINER